MHEKMEKLRSRPIAVAGVLAGFALANVSSAEAHDQQLRVQPVVHEYRADQIQPDQQQTAAITTETLREQLARERQQWRDERRRLLIRANAKKPIERTALQLAHATYGVPINGLLALATCESNRTPSAQNKTPLSGSRASGYAQILYHPNGIRSSTWHTTPYAEMSPFDLTTNIMAAAYIWKRNDGKSHPGFGEWRDVCTGIGDRASRRQLESVYVPLKPKTNRNLPR